MGARFGHGFAALIAIATMIGAESDAGAQDGLPTGERADQHYVNATRMVLRNVTKATRPTLLISEGETAARISYRVTKLREISVLSDIHRGQRVVVFSLGAVRALDSLARAWLADRELGRQGCFRDYADYVLRGTAAGAAMAGGDDGPAAPGAVADFFSYGGDADGPCHGLAAADFAARAELAEYNAAIMDATIAFITLHATAHHLLGHFDHDKINTRRRRAFEADADAWAFAHAIAIQVNPFAALPNWWVFSVLDGRDLTAGEGPLHPKGLHRFARRLEGVERASRDPRAYLRRFGVALPQEALDELGEVRVLVDRLLAPSAAGSD